MIKAIAIDDEVSGLEIIKTWSEKCSELHVVKYFTSSEKALDYVQEYPVELIFLDIQMPDLNGLEFAKKIPPHIKVVFTTAYSNFAVQGFELNAVDYLLKPFSLERFQSSIIRTQQRIAEEKNSKDLTSDSIYVRTDKTLIRIKLNNIIGVEALDDYIKIHQLIGRPIVARMTLKTLITKLPTNFRRVHRSWIVNLEHVSKYNKKHIWIQSLEIPISSNFNFDKENPK